MIDDQTWCVERASQDISWRHVFSVFTKDLWMVLICTFLTIAVIIYAIAHLDDQKENIYWALLRGVAICISTSPQLWPITKFHVRIFIFILLLYGMLINMMFSCFLMTTLTKQRFQTQISTINDTIHENFSYAGGSVVQSQLLQHNSTVRF